MTPVTLCRVEPVQPCAEDDFVVMVHECPIEVSDMAETLKIIRRMNRCVRSENPRACLKEMSLVCF